MTRVELWDITPLPDICHCVELQMTAECEKRAAILEAESKTGLWRFLVKEAL